MIIATHCISGDALHRRHRIASGTIRRIRDLMHPMPCAPHPTGGMTDTVLSSRFL
jgi:hypothetical protein